LKIKIIQFPGGPVRFIFLVTEAVVSCLRWREERR
jgi:hypothetical protein